LGLKVDLMADVELEKTTWPLYLSKHTLTIMCQIYALRINNKNKETQIRNEITQIWLLFLNSLKKIILKRELQQNCELLNNGKCCFV
jgi:hypothetical protein